MTAGNAGNKPGIAATKPMDMPATRNETPMIPKIKLAKASFLDGSPCCWTFGLLVGFGVFGSVLIIFIFRGMCDVA